MALLLVGSWIAPFAQTVQVPAERVFIDDYNRLVLVQHGELEDIDADSVAIPLGMDRRDAVFATSLSYRHRYTASFGDEAYALYFTRYPVLSFASDSIIRIEPKTPGQFRYADAENVHQGWLGVELRGGYSLGRPKSTFDIELWDDSSGEDTRKEPLAGLRDDDDWVLDALHNEPLRIRSTVAAEFWLDLHEPYYIELEPEAKAGFGVRYIEVFVHGTYRGVYGLHEQIDRKQLQLVRPDEETGATRGELYKSYSSDRAARFDLAAPPQPSMTQWEGLEPRFPTRHTPVDWSNVRAANLLVGEASDSEFAARAPSMWAIDNLLDYFIFINVFNAVDNTGKNIYSARYDSGEPYFLVPWDLDAIVGNYYTGARDTSPGEIISNRLFDRLIELNVEGFAERLQKRWQGLRKGLLREQALHVRFDKLFTRLDHELLYERESLVHGNYPFDLEELNFIREWIVDRLHFLDHAIGEQEVSSSYDLPSNQELVIAPNPTRGPLTLFGLPLDFKGSFEVHDLAGRRVLSGPVEGPFSINCSPLLAGAYVLTVRGRNRSESVPLLLQH